MPCCYLIDTKRRLILSTGWGCVTFADIKAHQDQLTSDPKFNPNFSQLVDATAVTKVEISVDEAKTLVGRKLFSSESRRAFVGNGLSVPAAGRLMQAYSRLTGPPGRISVFHDRDAAAQWLGLENVSP